ncbi:MAG: hypothetical protein ACKN9T_00540 [Candidatus Methylumidiphilus sp.]
MNTQFEKETVAESGKVDKVFRDIQNQLLVAPTTLAYIFFVGEFDDKGIWSSRNFLIWLAALLFSILMNLLLRYQHHTLQTVKQEIDQLWGQIKDKDEALVERFENTYSRLDQRYHHQAWLISVISHLVALALYIATVMALFYSTSSAIMADALKIGFLFGATPFVFWDLAGKLIPALRSSLLRVRSRKTRLTPIL